MKYRYLFLLLIFICLAVSACFSPLDYKGSGGSISITLPGDNSEIRSALPDVDTLVYTLTLKGPGGEEKTGIQARKGETLNISVSPGLWYILVEAQENGKTDLLAIGEYAVNVEAGRKSSAPIKMAVYTEVPNVNSIQGVLDCGYLHEEFIVISGTSTLSATITIPAGKKVTIVARSDAPSWTISGSVNFFVVNPSSHLILGSAYPESPYYGEVVLRDPATNPNYTAVEVQGGGSFTMNSGVTITHFEYAVSVSGADSESGTTPGTFEMNGGTIGTLNQCGVDNSGDFTMNSGIISGNWSYGVINNTEGRFTMNSGSISGNGSYGVDNSGYFTMNGGDISGGEVTVGHSQGIFKMRGGSITWNGCAVYSNRDSLPELIMSGSAYINNVLLSNYDAAPLPYITIEGTLTHPNYGKSMFTLIELGYGSYPVDTVNYSDKVKVLTGQPGEFSKFKPFLSANYGIDNNGYLYCIQVP